MSKFPFVSIESIANKVAMGPFGSSIKVETFTSEGIPIISGAHLHNVKLTDGNYNFISPAHASNLKNSIVHKKDIIFTHAGNIGQVSYIPDNSKYKNYIISQRQFYLRCNERALPEYVAYYFKSQKGKFSLLANSSQVGVPSIAQPVSYLKSIKIPLPEKKVQLAIVNILCSFDDKIELNRKMNETLEEMAQAVFQDWFVDFGPVKRKAKGITDPVAILGGLIPNPAQAQKIASLFPDQFAEDGLPLGSKIIKLQDILELAYGKSLPQKRRAKGSIPVYGSGGITGYHNECLIDGPSIIIGRKGSIGTIYWENSPSFPIDTVFYVKSEFPLIYLYFLLKQFDLKAMNTDAAVPGLNRNNVYRLQIPYLNKTVIEKYASLMTPLFSYCRSNLDQNNTLAEMRDLLLPKLMSGEISVDDLEKKMGGVL
ncbi:restriction endonuclease subunit S [uncultured Bartonella sp.]|uniref:restriction endonuclease subunit S n=1 Tax=uncultured Bartonella sp. TaxID=104108 RepID=UPI0025F72BE6|nr:restriction endonuclease subunit S [uncultured Bartonella sp.]